MTKLREQITIKINQINIQYCKLTIIFSLGNSSFKSIAKTGSSSVGYHNERKVRTSWYTERIAIP